MSDYVERALTVAVLAKLAALQFGGRPLSVAAVVLDPVYYYLDWLDDANRAGDFAGFAFNFSATAVNVITVAIPNRLTTPGRVMDEVLRTIGTITPFTHKVSVLHSHDVIVANVHLSPN